MRKIFVVMALLSFGVTTTSLCSAPVKAGSLCAPRADIQENNRRLTYTNVAKLSVSGNANTIVISGRCNLLNVTGNSNTIVVQRCDNLALSGNFNRITVKLTQNISTLGNNNKVTWRNSVNKKAPSISNLGSHNSIVHARR